MPIFDAITHSNTAENSFKIMSYSLVEDDLNKNEYLKLNLGYST